MLQLLFLRGIYGQDYIPLRDLRTPLLVDDHTCTVVGGCARGIRHRDSRLVEERTDETGPVSHYIG